MKRLFLVAAVLAALSSAVPSTAAPIVIGLPPDAGMGFCFPFGCSYSGEYQQVYSSSVFSGPMTITGLEFYNTQFKSSATFMNTGNWAISLSTTSADWNTLSSTYASNIGADDTLVFSGDLHQPWTFGDTLTVIFTQPFLYDPTNGNLLMDVFVTGASSVDGEIFFDYGGNSPATRNTIMGRVSQWDGTAASVAVVHSGAGLVTGFETAQSVPDAGSSLLLFGTGLTAAAAFRRRLAR